MARSNAYAGFQENTVGRIAPGFLADLTMLDADLLRVDVEAIKQVSVLRTIGGGRERFGGG